MNSVPDWNAMALVLDDIAHGNKGHHSASDVLFAAFGDTVLYVEGPNRKEHLMEHFVREEILVQVWPTSSAKTLIIETELALQEDLEGNRNRK